jgi:hypothetical protein
VVTSVRKRAPGLLTAAALTAALLVVGCYPGGPESYSDLGLIVTAKNPDAQYAGLLNFAMRDTVYALTGPSGEGDPHDRDYDRVILDELRAQMIAAGFNDVTADTATVDVHAWLSVGAVQNTVWYYWYDWGYWGGWCCYYPPAVGVGNFDKGSVVWQLVDVREAGAQVDPSAVWLAGINGVISGSAPANSDGIRRGIRQAFDQSPYIHASPAGQ